MGVDTVQKESPSRLVEASKPEPALDLQVGMIGFDNTFLYPYTNPY